MIGSARSLREVFPDPSIIPSIDAEELGSILLRLAWFQTQNGMFMLVHVLEDLHGSGHGQQPLLNAACKQALAEGWHWLALNALIMPAEGINGTNGYMVYTRRGQAIAGGEQDLRSFKAAAAFPRQMLHPAIAEKVWLTLARGDLADAVFIAFRTVEEAVRAKAELTDLDFGVPLMRKAFDKSTGRLTNMEQTEPEREALAHLFAGAIGSYKNPHSHRTVTIGDAREAQEMVTLATHLLRIVDGRTRRADAP